MRTGGLLSISDCGIVNVLSKMHRQTQALGEMLFPFFTDGKRDRWREAEKRVHMVAERKDPGYRRVSGSLACQGHS